MDGADVCRTSSRASRRPPDVISAVAILDPRWRRRKWRHPGSGVLFWIPIAVRGAKWRPFRFRSPSWMTSEWGHPRWRPEAEGPPFCTAHRNGDPKKYPILLLLIRCWCYFHDVFEHAKMCPTQSIWVCVDMAYFAMQIWNIIARVH